LTVPGSRWTSFVADEARRGTLHEQGNAAHRCRVEHDAATLLVHLSDEDGDGWTTLAVDRATRSWAVAQAPTQVVAATRAVDLLREGTSAIDPGVTP
jgi:hypothetical protein